MQFVRIIVEVPSLAPQHVGLALSAAQQKIILVVQMDTYVQDHFVYLLGEYFNKFHSNYIHFILMIR